MLRGQTSLAKSRRRWRCARPDELRDPEWGPLYTDAEGFACLSEFTGIKTSAGVRRTGGFRRSGTHAERRRRTALGGHRIRKRRHNPLAGVCNRRRPPLGDLRNGLSIKMCVCGQFRSRPAIHSHAHTSAGPRRLRAHRNSGRERSDPAPPPHVVAPAGVGPMLVRQPLRRLTGARPRSPRFLAGRNVMRCHTGLHPFRTFDGFHCPLAAAHKAAIR